MPRREEAEVEFLQPLLLRQFGVELAKLASITLVVYVQENVGWEWGLGVPIVAMLVAVTAFMWGPLYVNMAPGGSPCTRLAQVVFAAFRKRNVTMLSDATLLYHDEVLDAAISTVERLLRTNQLR